jgi:hypothetical protein
MEISERESQYPFTGDKVLAEFDENLAYFCVKSSL